MTCRNAPKAQSNRTTEDTEDTGIELSRTRYLSVFSVFSVVQTGADAPPTPTNGPP
jgi:hypothetical protein